MVNGKTRSVPLNILSSVLVARSIPMFCKDAALYWHEIERYRGTNRYPYFPFFLVG